MTKKRSKLFITAASMLTFSPVIAIVSCAGGNNQTGNNQTGKLSLKANEFQLKNISDQDAQDYAKQSNDTVTYYKKLRTLIFEQRENLFQGDLTNFNANDILVSQVEVNNPEIGIGTLKFLLEVRKVNQTLLNPATIILKGFKTDVFSLKATEIKLIGQEQVDLRKINLQNFIFEVKEQIFNNIPKDLTTDQIIVEDVKKRPGSLIAFIRILEKRNPQQERFHLI